MVLADLKKYRDRRQAVAIIYLNKRGQTSRRIIRILLLDEEAGRLKAYCYTRKACRVFAIAGILALVPVAGQFAG
ncbi:WYL domain-containing protein [Brevibacillus sp. SAFN-007a]|uniref:WYL domain-containing protein n=1 Tax=Brevibacillus sp. SAFN-007a TaxID=3436862 RepID=UPI003F820B43